MAEEKQNNNDYIFLFHRSKLVKTLADFMEREHIYNIELQEFFDLNKEIIWQQYTFTDKISEMDRTGKWPTSADDLTKDSLLPQPPCKLKINPSKVTAELAINQTNAQVETSDFYAFADDKIQDIFQNEGYRKDSVIKQSLDCSVFGWFKSMYSARLGKKNKKVHQEESEFVDLSRHVIDLATNVTSNGGSFTITLPTVSSISNFATMGGEYGEKLMSQAAMRKSGTDKSPLSGVVSNDEGEYFSKNSFNDSLSNYFNWLISANDLIFISFEKLEMERSRNEKAKLEDDDVFDINTAISDNVFDMIGLVDEVKVVTDSSNSSSTVEITGRDLMKLLIDDGSFFFNPSTSSDPSQVFANEQSYGKQGDIKEADLLNGTYSNPINRLRRISGEIDIFTNRINADLGYVLKGVISQLANIEIVPGYVFDSWGDERTKYIDLEPKTEERDA